MMMLGRIWSEESENLQREHQWPRRIGGTHPERISLMWNVLTPMRSVGSPAVSQPQGRPKPPAGEGRIEKRMPVAERQGESITRRIGQYPTRKGADAILVDYPKGDVKGANRGES
jgi:hypothetical protein